MAKYISSDCINFFRCGGWLGGEGREILQPSLDLHAYEYQPRAISKCNNYYQGRIKVGLCYYGTLNWCPYVHHLCIN